MKDTKKAADFFEAVEKAGLKRAFEKISAIAADKIGCYLEDLIDDFVVETKQPECRIRYCKKDQDGDECYIFETRQSGDEEFGLCISFLLIDDMINYQALTQIREMMHLGYKIQFK